VIHLPDTRKEPRMRDCVFCKIIDGTAPSNMVAKFHLAVAFKPLNPVPEGHGPNNGVRVALGILDWG
jgi:hypothetical protein